MWSSTNQRIKALMSARQREKERLGRPIHVRRADLKLSFRDDSDFLVEIPARALLNDFTPTGFSVYAVERLTTNVELTVEIEHPKYFRLTAKVVWCQYQPTSTHVLTTQSYPYRVGIAFIWKDKSLEESFTKFCSELNELYVNTKGIFIEENFAKTDATSEASTATSAVPDVPAPTESDEGGAPRDGAPTDAGAASISAAAPVPSEPAAVAAAPAPEAPSEGNPVASSTESASSVLDALKDFDPGVSSEEKKAA